LFFSTFSREARRPMPSVSGLDFSPPFLIGFSSSFSCRTPFLPAPLSFAFPATRRPPPRFFFHSLSVKTEEAACSFCALCWGARSFRPLFTIARVSFRPFLRNPPRFKLFGAALHVLAFLFFLKVKVADLSSPPGSSTSFFFTCYLPPPNLSLGADFLC